MEGACCGDGVRERGEVGCCGAGAVCGGGFVGGAWGGEVGEVAVWCGGRRGGGVDAVVGEREEGEGCVDRGVAGCAGVVGDVDAEGGLRV